MNDVYACLVVVKEAATIIFFVVCIAAVVKTCLMKDKTKKDGE